LLARNKRIELATLANPSCGKGIQFESIWRTTNLRRHFHAARLRKRDYRPPRFSEGYIVELLRLGLAISPDEFVDLVPLRASNFTMSFGQQQPAGPADLINADGEVD
jgi:hypothetical protein